MTPKRPTWGRQGRRLRDRSRGFPDLRRRPRPSLRVTSLAYHQERITRRRRQPVRDQAQGRPRGVPVSRRADRPPASYPRAVVPDSGRTSVKPSELLSQGTSYTLDTRCPGVRAGRCLLGRLCQRFLDLPLNITYRCGDSGQRPRSAPSTQAETKWWNALDLTPMRPPAYFPSASDETSSEALGNPMEDMAAGIVRDVPPVSCTVA
jgi:hypothetical protein